MSINTREIIADTLYILETENKKSHLLLRDVLEKYDYLDFRDKAFIKRVTEGTISGKITLDYILDSFSKKPMDKCKPMVRVILRMSAYQILFMDKVPDNAACDEAVKLVKKLSFETFGPFVNGILRNICKSKETLLNFDNIEDTAERLSVKYSVPLWIVKMFMKEQKDAEALLKAMNTVKGTCVRFVKTDKKAEYLSKWDAEGISFRESKYVEDAYLLSDFEGIETVSGFNDGVLMVQDESSMLASMAAGVKKNSDLTVIDVCAAPGGKTCFVASLMENGKVISCDVSDLKVSLIEENVSRMGLKNVVPTVWDATVLNEEFVEKADIVIADVPCSGLGVMSRKSDIKYNISNESMKEICDLQKKIVENVYRYVKPGGVLIYSTCTIHKAENEKMVKYILENLPFKGDSLKPFIPKLFKIERPLDYAVQMLPNVDGTDGFFVSRFVRK